jgi:hypothetical protein
MTEHAYSVVWSPVNRALDLHLALHLAQWMAVSFCPSTYQNATFPAFFSDSNLEPHGLGSVYVDPHF